MRVSASQRLAIACPSSALPGIEPLPQIAVPSATRPVERLKQRAPFRVAAVRLFQEARRRLHLCRRARLTPAFL